MIPPPPIWTFNLLFFEVKSSMLSLLSYFPFPLFFKPSLFSFFVLQPSPFPSIFSPPPHSSLTAFSAPHSNRNVTVTCLSFGPVPVQSADYTGPQAGSVPPPEGSFEWATKRPAQAARLPSGVGTGEGTSVKWMRKSSSEARRASLFSPLKFQLSALLTGWLERILLPRQPLGLRGGEAPAAEDAEKMNRKKLQKLADSLCKTARHCE